MAIPLTEWPQQHLTILKPAMQTDLKWHDFGTRTDKIVQQCLNAYTGSDYQRMLSVVMPGFDIEPHKDQQAPYWKARIHIPLQTNSQSEFFVDGLSYQMKVGTAYLVNTLKEHSVVNNGNEPRIHFMFDVKHA